MPPDLPIRVAVISRNHVVRSGLVSLIAQLEDRAVVTEAVALDDHLGHHDVAIYDLGAVDGEIEAYTDLRRLLDSGSEVIGLVYDQARETLPPVKGARSHVITLSVTPAQLLDVLHESVAPRTQHRGDPEELLLPAGLTEQEFRVIEQIGAGHSNQVICQELYVSINTVKSTIRSAYRKIGVADRSGAMLWALEHGLAGGLDRR